MEQEVRTNAFLVLLASTAVSLVLKIQKVLASKVTIAPQLQSLRLKISVRWVITALVHPDSRKYVQMGISKIRKVRIFANSVLVLTTVFKE